jgi:hypothetical protein
MNLIRKIIIGQNPKDAMAYYTGMRVGEGKVVVIEFNERAYHKNGIISYCIYIEQPYIILYLHRAAQRGNDDVEGNTGDARYRGVRSQLLI